MKWFSREKERRNNLVKLLWPGIQAKVNPIIDSGFKEMKFAIDREVIKLLDDLDYPEEITQHILGRLDLRVEFHLEDEK